MTIKAEIQNSVSFAILIACIEQYNLVPVTRPFFRLLIQSTKRNCTRRTTIAEATRYNNEATMSGSWEGNRRIGHASLTSVVYLPTGSGSINKGDKNPINGPRGVW